MFFHVRDSSLAPRRLDLCRGIRAATHRLSVAIGGTDRRRNDCDSERRGLSRRSGEARSGDRHASLADRFGDPAADAKTRKRVRRDVVANSSGTAYGEYLYVPPRLDTLPPGYITTIAGVGSFVGDGRLDTRAMIDPFAVRLDRQGTVYIADFSAQRIRRIRADGVIETVVGTGIRGEDGDGGPASDATLTLPQDAAFDSAGNLYIVDLSNRLRRVDAVTGVITTVAGKGEGQPGFGGDGGPASEALLNIPQAVAIDRDGNIYIQEFGNARVRRIRRAESSPRMRATAPSDTPAMVVPRPLPN